MFTLVGLPFVSGRTDRAAMVGYSVTPGLHVPRALAGGVSLVGGPGVLRIAGAASFHEPHGPPPFHAIERVDNFVSIENGY